MGKGGVGKTTIAVAIARGLASRGLQTHLSTTDPAGRPADVVGESTANLTVSRIDPEAAVAHYVDEKLRAAGDLDPEQRALLEEDLRSPCTGGARGLPSVLEPAASRARPSAVVVDTAPTGHTLLLLDRTGAYHHDVMRSATRIHGRITTPLMRLRDPTFTRVSLVTLAETTPVHEAAVLQVDLRRSGIEPFGWVINATLAASGTRDPVLRQRATLEYRHLRRVEHELGRALLDRALEHSTVGMIRWPECARCPTATIEAAELVPRPRTHSNDVIVTMGCGDACPVYPGKRYLDWELTDPAGKTVEEVRPIIDHIDERVRQLLAGNSSGSRRLTHQGACQWVSVVVCGPWPETRGVSPGDGEASSA